MEADGGYESAVAMWGWELLVVTEVMLLCGGCVASLAVR